MGDCQRGDAAVNRERRSWKVAPGGPNNICGIRAKGAIEDRLSMYFQQVTKELLIALWQVGMEPIPVAPNCRAVFVDSSAFSRPRYPKHSAGI